MFDAPAVIGNFACRIGGETPLIARHDKIIAGVANRVNGHLKPMLAGIFAQPLYIFQSDARGWPGGVRLV